MTKDRSEIIDLLKGFAIILVIIGHCVQNNLPQSFNDHSVFRVIYSFHMPLFMFLSGYVAYISFSGKSKQLLSRARTLMIPFFSWFVIFFFLHYHHISFALFFRKLTALLLSPDRGLWFLWVLFLNYLLLFVASKLTRKQPLIIMILFFVLINIVNIFVQPKAGMGALGWYILFFTAGYATKKYELTQLKVFRFAGYFSLIVFPVLVVFWYRDSTVQLSTLLKNSSNGMLYLKYVYGLAVPLTGILASFSLMNWLTKALPVFIKNIINYLGRISLELYYTHFFFFSLIFLIPPMNIVVKIFITFIMVTLLSVSTQYLINKNKYLGLVIYGRAIKKK